MRIFLSIYIGLFSLFAEAFEFDNEAKQYEVSASYVLMNMNYDMSGTGFTSKTGNLSGNGMQFRAAWNRPEAQYQFDYYSASAEEDAPSGLSPANTETEFTRILLQYTPAGGDSFSMSSGNKWNWAFGLDYRMRDSTRTTPNQFVSSYNTLGGWVGLKYNDRLFDDKVSFKSGMGLLIPLIQSEGGQQTGNLKWNLSPDLHAMFGMKINSALSVSIGLQVLMELKSYSGTAERGVTNAEETFFLFNVPFEIKYEF